MSLVTIIGAGRLGKGFIGETFSNANWDIVFIDKDKNVIEALNENNSYCVDVHTTTSINTNIVDQFEAFHTSDKNNTFEAINRSDLIFLSIYPEDFDDAFDYLIEAFEDLVHMDKQHKLSILCLTNKNGLIPKFEKYLKDNMTLEMHQWYSENVVLRDTIIRRSTDADSNASLDVRTVAVKSLLIQKPLTVDISRVQWMELTDNLEILKQVKVFAVNGPHAASAYYGWYYGYHTINDVMKDNAGIAFVNQIEKEIKAAVLLEYKITEEQLYDLTHFPEALGTMTDSITRVGKDPTRKLSKRDRLTGSALIAYKHGLPYENLAKAIAYGLVYNNAEDQEALKIQSMIKNSGLNQTIRKICGLECSHPIFKEITRTYKNIRRGIK